MPITDTTTEVPEFFVIEAATNDTIRPRVVQIEKMNGRQTSNIKQLKTKDL